MIFFDKTRTIGQDANGKNVVWVSVYVDTAANLPAYNDYQSDGFILCMASEGRCIDTGDLYRLDSSGTWQISQAGTGTYTKAEIDALLNAKQDVLTFDSTPTQDSANPVTSGGIWTDQQRQDVLQNEDRDALIELVDGGAKNKFDPASAWDSKTAYGVTITRTGDTYSIESGTTQSGDNLFLNMGYQANTNLIPAGDWALSFDTPQQNIALQVCWNNSLKVSASFGDKLFFTVPENTTNSWFRIRLRGSTDMTGTSFKIMLCPLILWKISQAYQPYRPSWQEMYDQVSTIDGITAKIVYTNALLVNTGTSIGSTGLEYTIAGTSTATYRLTAVASYNASQPDELRLVNKITGALYGIAKRSDVGTSASIIVGGCVATGSNITVEVQAKYMSTGNNYIRFIVEKIPT